MPELLSLFNLLYYNYNQVLSLIETIPSYNVAQ